MTFAVGAFLVLPGRPLAQVLAVGETTYDLCVVGSRAPLQTFAQASVEQCVFEVLELDTDPPGLPPSRSRVLFRSNDSGTLHDSPDHPPVPLGDDTPWTVTLWLVDAAEPGSFYALLESCADPTLVMVAADQEVTLLASPP